MDVVATLKVSFDEAYAGTKKKFSVNVPGRKSKETLNLTIPAGSVSGTKLKIPGHGKPGKNGQSDGNLVIEIKVEDHPFYKVNGKNIEVNLPITFCEAVLGQKVEVPLPSGKRVLVKVPSGAKSGKRLTIKGQGMHSKNSTGNLIAILDVVVPDKLNDKQKAALEKYNKIESKEVRPW